jgi:hypothetical protein
MTIEELVARRCIREVLHFTTNSGLTGILVSNFIKARPSLRKDKYLEHILKPNCPNRQHDVQWHGYVNLSITRINTRLFGISEGNWHRDLDGWWCILAFDPIVLSHDNVLFTTTNNIYPSCRRGTGVAGLEAMFAPVVKGWYGVPITRHPGKPDSEPTCIQAEVLYPQEVSTEYLRRIYVREEEHRDSVHGIFGALSLTPVECVIHPAHFA